MIHRAMKGLGCNDKILNEVLVTRTNEELKEASAFFQEQHNEDMVEMVKSETAGFFSKGDYGKWIDVLLEFDQDQSENVPDTDTLQQQAKELYDAGAGKWTGTDEEVFTRILAKASRMHITALCTAYDNLEDSTRSLIDDVKKEMGGNLEFAVVAKITPKWEFLASRIHAACKGFGTDEETICRVLAGLTKEEIADKLVPTYDAVYAVEDGMTFMQCMESETSGDFLTAIRCVALTTHVSVPNATTG
jgi:hypothetical protein